MSQIPWKPGHESAPLHHSPLSGESVPHLISHPKGRSALRGPSGLGTSRNPYKESGPEDIRQPKNESVL